MTRRALGILLGVAAAIATIVLAWTFWPTRQPPMDAPLAELVKFVTTDAFDNLPDDKKVAYVQTLLDKGLPALALRIGELRLRRRQCERR